MPLRWPSTISHLPPVCTVFAAMLGYNPVQNLLAPSGAAAAPARAERRQVLTGRQFFPHLISAPFHHGLIIVFTAAAVMALTGAAVSWLRGKRFYYEDKVPPTGSAAMVPNGAGRPPPPRGMSSEPPAPARRDSEAAPGA